MTFLLLSKALLVVSMNIFIFFYIDDSLLAANQFAGLGVAAILPALLYAVVQTGLSEELFFRGFLLKRLAQSFGVQMGNIMQSLLFGCIHGALLWLALPALAVLLVILLTALAGYIMGWLNKRLSGGSILTSS
ncbi:CPBP family intramembrane glutamic endopeptidase [Lysinibacillus sp. NPDC098008]|uniref:CPBP family intramembrane glutamic endopeptidase n=2 Tax=unclassified Lysinibacillus TaxID=2636778 RepID=UPI003827F88E